MSGAEAFAAAEAAATRRLGLGPAQHTDLTHPRTELASPTSTNLTPALSHFVSEGRTKLLQIHQLRDASILAAERKAVEAAQALEAARAAVMEGQLPQHEGAHESFLAWGRAAGINTHPAFSLVRTPLEGYGGLVRAPGLAEDEVAIAVPRRLSISLSTLPAELAQVCFELPESTALEHNHVLALALCQLTPGSSAPWFGLWPQAPEGSWGFEDRSAWGWYHELGWLHERAEAAARRVHAEVIEPHLASRGEPGVSWARFRHALSMVSSRAADVPINGEAQPAIIPMVDMLNHRNEPNARIVYEPAAGPDGQDRFVVRATRAVRAGESLCLCYGAKENAELLHNYGFAVYPNPHDSVMVRVSLGAEDDPLTRQRISVVPRGMQLSRLEVATRGSWRHVAAHVARGETPAAAAEAAALGAGARGEMAVWGHLEWSEGRRSVALSPALRTILCIASADSPPQLFEALRSIGHYEEQGISPVDRVSVVLPERAWSKLSASCDAELGRLPSTDAFTTPGSLKARLPSNLPSGAPPAAAQDPQNAMRLALEARRELLERAAGVAAAGAVQSLSGEMREMLSLVRGQAEESLKVMRAAREGGNSEGASAAADAARHAAEAARREAEAMGARLEAAEAAAAQRGEAAAAAEARRLRAQEQLEALGAEGEEAVIESPRRAGEEDAA